MLPCSRYETNTTCDLHLCVVLGLVGNWCPVVVQGASGALSALNLSNNQLAYYTGTGYQYLTRKGTGLHDMTGVIALTEAISKW